MKVLLTKNVYQEIMFYVDKSPVEISGVGRVKRQDNGDLLVTKIYLLNQVNSSAATDIDQEALAKLMYESREDQPIYGDLTFWWHSHVHMGVFWSGTDMATIKQFGKNGYLVSTVFNKKNELRSSYYQGDNGFLPALFMDELKTEIHNPAKTEEENNKYLGVTQEVWETFSLFDKLEYYDIQRTICENAIKEQWGKDYDEKCKRWSPPVITGGYHGGYYGSRDYDVYDRTWQHEGQEYSENKYWWNTTYERAKWGRTWNSATGKWEYHQRTSVEEGQAKRKKTAAETAQTTDIPNGKLPNSISKITLLSGKVSYWSSTCKLYIEPHMDCTGLDEDAMELLKVLEANEPAAEPVTESSGFVWKGNNTQWELEMLHKELRTIVDMKPLSLDDLTIWDLCVLYDIAEAIYDIADGTCQISDADLILRDAMANVDEVCADLTLAVDGITTNARLDAEDAAEAEDVEDAVANRDAETLEQLEEMFERSMV